MFRHLNWHMGSKCRDDDPDFAFSGPAEKQDLFPIGGREKMVFPIGGSND